MEYILAKPLSIYELGKRANQEDSIFPEHNSASEADRVFVVCDGMGGHESGEVASATVCQTLARYIIDNSTDDGFDQQLFLQALSATYDALDAKDNGAAKKMGTTMTFMKLYKDGCLLAHIGDSRIYHIRPSEKTIIYKSRDHSLVNDLYDVGEITLEQMKTSKQKNIITRAMQPLQERRAKADIKIITDIKEGDYFFLCTDGILEQMEDENLINILAMDTPDQEKVRILTEVTAENKDNHSAYLVRIEKVVADSAVPVADVAVPIVAAPASVPAQESINQAVESISSQTVEASAPAAASKFSEDDSSEVEPKKGPSMMKLAVLVFLILAIFAGFIAYKVMAKSEDGKTESRVEQHTSTPHREPRTQSRPSRPSRATQSKPSEQSPIKNPDSAPSREDTRPSRSQATTDGEQSLTPIKDLVNDGQTKPSSQSSSSGRASSQGKPSSQPSSAETAGDGRATEQSQTTSSPEAKRTGKVLEQ